MSFYTVQIPDEAPDAFTRADRMVVLRDGFSLPAFVFGLLFFLWHRLWIGAAVWIVLTVALVAFAVLLHPPLIGLLVLALLMHLYAGVEGNDLLRWGLARRGYMMRDLVSAPDLDTAEALALARQPEVARADHTAPAPAARFMGPAAVPAVIGIFPDGGAA